MATTKQVEVKPKRVPNPTGKGGFAERPQDRADGRWSGRESISHQYHKMIHMSLAELEAIQNKPKSQMTVAEMLALGRVIAARKSLPDMKEITDRTEGKAKESIDLTADIHNTVELKGTSDDELSARLERLIASTKAGSDSDTRGTESTQSLTA